MWIEYHHNHTTIFSTAWLGLQQRKHRSFALQTFPSVCTLSKSVNNAFGVSKWWRLMRTHYATKWPPHYIDRNICRLEHMSSSLSWLSYYIINVMTLNSRTHFKDCRHNSNYSQRYYKASSYKHGGHQFLALVVEKPPGVGCCWRCVVVVVGSLRRHQMETFFALLALCGDGGGGGVGWGGVGGGGGGGSSGRSPSQRTGNTDLWSPFVVSLNKRMNKHSIGR